MVDPHRHPKELLFLSADMDVINLLKKIFEKRERQRVVTPRQVFIEELIGEPLGNLELYTQALTHRSYESRGANGSNERLEFLGDSVVDLAVGHALIDLYPEEDEGTLTSIRSFLVSRNNMNKSARQLGLDRILYADSSLDLCNSDVLGNALEALIGAIYLDKGFDFTAQFVRQHFIISKQNVSKVAKKEEDYKTEFIIIMQRHKIEYKFEHLDSTYRKDVGMIHRCELLIGPDLRGITTGVGTSKKIAHQNAAKDALTILKKHPELLDSLV